MVIRRKKTLNQIFWGMHGWLCTWRSLSSVTLTITELQELFHNFHSFIKNVQNVSDQVRLRLCPPSNYLYSPLSLWLHIDHPMVIFPLIYTLCPGKLLLCKILIHWHFLTDSWGLLVAILHWPHYVGSKYFKVYHSMLNIKSNNIGQQKL